MRTGAPTKEWIVDALTHLTSFYRQRNTNMQVWRNLYYSNPENIWIDSAGNYVPPEEDEIRITLPIAYTHVESYMSLLLARPPVLSVPASEVYELHEDYTDYLEKVLYGLWYRGGILRSVKDALWHALVDGWGVLQIRFDPDAEERFELPLWVDAVDPMGFYAMPGNRPNDWVYALVCTYHIVGELRKSYVSGRDGRKASVKAAKAALAGLNEDDRVLLVEYWDKEFYAALIRPTDTEIEDPAHAGAGAEWLIPPTKHNYGSFPFVVFYGIEGPDRTRGERIGLSVIYPIEDLIRYTCQLVSQKASIIARYADPTLVVKSVDGRGFDFPSLRGGQLPLFTDEDAGYILPPGPTPAVDVQLEEIQGHMEMAGLPRHVMGQLSISRLSGIAMNLLRTPVLMKVAFKQMGMETALEELNSRIFSAISGLQVRPFYLWGHDPDGRPIEVVVDPAKIGEYRRNEVRLSASLPTDEPATVAMLTALAQLNIISRRTFRNIVQQTLRSLSPQSLKDEEDQVLIEQLIQMPPIQMALMMDAAKAADLHVLPFVQQMMGGKGGQQAPGIPGMGGAAGGGQMFPFPIQGARNPTEQQVMRRLATQTRGGRGGAPVGSVLGPTMVAERGAGE